MSSRRSASRHSEGSKAKVRAVQGTVLLGLVGGVGAYVGFDKTVHITVDGQERTIHTFDGKVADVLKAQGITTGEHDSVAPAPGRTWSTARRSPSTTAASSTSPSTAPTRRSGPPPALWPMPWAGWTCGVRTRTCR
ncbi:ubiquitin-like domain-containing protein [Catenulispora yoronensis]